MVKRKEIEPSDYSMLENNYCEIRSIYVMDFRNLCISNSWYTLGNVAEYTVLLEIVASAEDVTASMIHEWAFNIKEHSETEYELTDIMFEIAKICSHHFYIRE